MPTKNSKKAAKKPAKKTTRRPPKAGKLPRRIAILLGPDGELQKCKNEDGKCTDSLCPKNYECVTVQYLDKDGIVVRTECVCMRSRPD